MIVVHDSSSCCRDAGILVKHIFICTFKHLKIKETFGWVGMAVNKIMPADKFFIQEHLERKAFHGGIGLVDIEKILSGQGYRPIIFPYHTDFSFKAKLFRLHYLIKVLMRMPAGSLLIFQFPLYARMNRLLLRLMQFKKRMTIICLVADINGLKDDNKILLRKEIKELRRYHYFIVHNLHMQQWLAPHVVQARFSLLCFFDFQAAVIIKERVKSHTIVFAGNLEKSSFLEKLESITANNQRLKFNLYGPNATAVMKSQINVIYKGVFDPYQLPDLLEGSFGLVWDGDSIDGPAGSFGHYMQYISHHKLSLYILSKLPIIVFENAGSAQFIKTHQIGFTVSHLHELKDRIDALTEKEYQQMVKNLHKYALRISTGKYLTEAIQQLVTNI